MKTFISSLALLALILTSSFTVTTQQQVNAQQTQGSFQYLRVHRQGKTGAGLTWSVSNHYMSHFIIERSYDGEFFDAVDTVPGSGTSVYRHTDASLYPGFIHYRITAVFPDGSQETSAVSTLRIVQRK